MLFSQMTPPIGKEDAFEAWYDDDHIARRMELPGYSLAHRLWNVDGDRHHLAIYELDDLDALNTEGYRRLKADPGPTTKAFLASVTGFTRFTAACIGDVGEPHAIGRYLSVVAFAVPEAEQEEFDHWYVAEHEPLLLEAASWLRIRRYDVLDGDGGPWTRFAIHELDDLDAMDSAERARARSAPLRATLADRPWFQDSGRWLYRRTVTHYAKRI